MYIYNMSKHLTKDEIIKQLHLIAKSCNCSFIGTYSKAKDKLEFKDDITGEILYATWDNLRYRKKIPRKKQVNKFKSKIKQLEIDFKITVLDNYKNYITKLQYKCNLCNKSYKRQLCNISKCHCQTRPYSKNKGINSKNVLKQPYQDYYLYLVYIPKYKCYKIGLYKKRYIKSRFNTDIKLISLIKLPFYKAYFIEQLVINKFINYKYLGEKFGGYTEAFNNKVPINKILLYMGASVKDVEPCELLETLEADNQQLSLDSDIFESSTTRIESQVDNNIPRAQGSSNTDDIV